MRLSGTDQSHVPSPLPAGELTCSGLVLAYLQRITALDQATQLNAVRSIVPGALRRAEALDRELESRLAAGNGSSSAAAPGAALPPLFCVPLLIKDNYDVAGAATTAGSAALQGNVPGSSAFVVERLVAQGAIALAKTNMGEFALFPTFCVGSGYGTVRNPYHLHRSPAGSSGGSGAGVAASFGMAGLGTDTGNSGERACALTTLHSAAVHVFEMIQLMSSRPTLHLLQCGGPPATLRWWGCAPPWASSAGAASCRCGQTATRRGPWLGRLRTL